MVMMDAGTLNISNNQFVNNWSYKYAGAIYLVSLSNATLIANNTFT